MVVVSPDTKKYILQLIELEMLQEMKEKQLTNLIQEIQ